MDKKGRISGLSKAIYLEVFYRPDSSMDEVDLEVPKDTLYSYMARKHPEEISNVDDIITEFRTYDMELREKYDYELIIAYDVLQKLDPTIGWTCVYDTKDLEDYFRDLTIKRAS
jgi:hypothetical protein